MDVRSYGCTSGPSRRLCSASTGGQWAVREQRDHRFNRQWRRAIKWWLQLVSENARRSTPPPCMPGTACYIGIVFANVLHADGDMMPPARPAARTQATQGEEGVVVGGRLQGGRVCALPAASC